MDRLTRTSRCVRRLTAVGALVPVLAITACSGQSNPPTSPSPIANSAPLQPLAPVAGSTVLSFSGFNQATLSVNVGTSTSSALAQSFIDEGKIHLSIWVNASGVPVPWVNGAAGTWVRVDQAGGGIPVVTALTSTVVDLDALAATFGPEITANAACGATVTFRAQYVSGGGSTKVATHFSTPTNYTITCGGACTTTFGQGYWKNHGNLWPVSSLTLGTTSYTKAQLLSILNQDPGHGPTANGLIILSYQLIAAKLNRANGSPNTNNVDAQIVAADTLIGGFVAPPIGSGYLAPNLVGTIKDALEAYNQSCSGSD